MVNRQAMKYIFLMGFLLALLSACSPPETPTPVPTQRPAPLSTPTMSMLISAESSPMPNKCVEQRGQVEKRAFDSVALPEAYIYLPPCYGSDPDTRYPVLYLLHGADYEADQWLRLGTAEKMDSLIMAGKIPAFLIVMPYEKYSLKSVNENDFGDALIEELLPYVDAHFLTQKNRAIGGLSRGGGWAIHYGLTHWELFGAIGGHSAAIFYSDNAKLGDWLVEIPRNALPQIYLDAGDKDQALSGVLSFVNILAEMSVPHEWRLFTGLHDEAYWSAHLEEYLRWYGKAFE